MAENWISPISVTPKSAHSSSKVALTGIPRKCQDNCVEIYNAVQKWKEFNVEGLVLIKQIADSQRSQRNEDDESCVEVENETHKTSENAQEICDQLQSVYNKMIVLKEKLELLTSQLAALSLLQHKSTLQTNLTVNNCLQRAEIITRCYSEELLLKKWIVENVAHVCHRDELLFVLAAWTHEPHLDNDLHLHLKVMLNEAGIT